MLERVYQMRKRRESTSMFLLIILSILGLINNVGEVVIPEPRGVQVAHASLLFVAPLFLFIVLNDWLIQSQGSCLLLLLLSVFSVIQDDRGVLH